jgi:hypothetical protein
VECCHWVATWTRHNAYNSESDLLLYSIASDLKIINGHASYASPFLSVYLVLSMTIGVPPSTGNSPVAGGFPSVVRNKKPEGP